jgi:hypothetical protein
MIPNGTKNDESPIARLGFRFCRNDCGSISAPARKVRKTTPKLASVSIAGVTCKPIRFPPTIPITISTRATVIPSLIEMRLAIKASPIHMLAVNHMLSKSALSFGGG